MKNQISFARGKIGGKLTLCSGFQVFRAGAFHDDGMKIIFENHDLLPIKLNFSRCRGLIGRTGFCHPCESKMPNVFASISADERPFEFTCHAR